MSSGGISEGLFSWLNEFFAWLFSLGMGGKLTWVTQYWPMLVLIIAVFVVLMDLLVWFIRYRPYKNWKRVWNSVLGRSHTTRPAQFTRREADGKRARSRYDLPAAPLAAERQRTGDTPVTAPLHPRGEDDVSTAPRASRAPAKVLDVPTIGRHAQKQNIVPMPDRSNAAKRKEPAQPPKPQTKAPAPPDDDQPTIR